MKNNHAETPLYDALINYGLKQNTIPFDVPGHKFGKAIPQRFKDDVGEAIFKIDVNSMQELDSLSNPIGVIKEAEALAADLFQASKAFFLVNGSTSGVQKMILSTCTDQDKLILPRHIHKSAFNAVVLSGARPIYIDPIYDEESGIAMGIRFEDVKETIDKNPDAKAILLLHPNYFGFTSDAKRIIDYAHEHGIAVLADQSHGSHFSLHEGYPKSAIELGADLATISMHKTGGSLSQSSILLYNSKLISYTRVRSTINLFQTSSASYLLLASLDIARSNLAMNKDALFTKTLALAEKASLAISKIPGFKIVNRDKVDGDAIFAHDSTKLTIDIGDFGFSGFHVYDYFKKHYNIQLELGESHVVLAIISIGDSDHSIDALINACEDFSRTHKSTSRYRGKTLPLETPPMRLTPREAFFKESVLIDINHALGRISADSIMIYPPGIPLVTPGEEITKKVIEHYSYYVKESSIVIGSHEKNETIYIKVLKEDAQ